MTIYSQLHRGLDKPIEFYANFLFSIFQFQDFVNFTIFVNRNYGISDFEIIIIMFSDLSLVNLISKKPFYTAK